MEENTITLYNPNAQENARGEKRNPKVGLIHELKHALDRNNHTLRGDKTRNGIKYCE